MNAELEALLLSLSVAARSVAFSLPFAILVAWLLTRARFAGRTLFDAFVHLPLVLPPVVVGYLLLVLFGVRGPIGSWLHEHFGVRPERMADYLALTGDSVDNIPGVPGVGPKTAAALLKVFESLEHLYDNLGEVPSLPIRGAARLPERLREHREAAYLARRLTRIACDMPLAVSATDLVRRAPDVPALESFYQRAGFGPMLARQARRLAQALDE